MYFISLNIKIPLARVYSSQFSKGCFDNNGDYVSLFPEEYRNPPWIMKGEKNIVKFGSSPGKSDEIMNSDDHQFMCTLKNNYCCFLKKLVME